MHTASLSKTGPALRFGQVMQSFYYLPHDWRLSRFTLHSCTLIRWPWHLFLKRGLEISFSCPKGIWKKEFYFAIFLASLKAFYIQDTFFACSVFLFTFALLTGPQVGPELSMETTLTLKLCWSPCLCFPSAAFPHLTVVRMRCVLTAHTNACAHPSLSLPPRSL